MLFRMSCCIYFASRAAAAKYVQMGITTQREILYLQGNEEEGVPEDGVGVTLPHQHVVGESLGQELVAVVEVDAHPDQDRQQGEQLELKHIENKVLRKYRQLLPEFR